jgi:hypothetical protein
MTFDYAAHSRALAKRERERRAGWPTVPSCPVEQDNRFRRIMADYAAGRPLDFRVRA